MADARADKVTIIDTTANPAPLGLLAFGMTTVLLNMHNAGWFGMSSMILAMGIFYGGMAQVFVGWMEWKKGNTFGMVAFSSYGLFWLTLVFLLLAPKWGWTDAPAGMVEYLFMWGLFTFALWVGTLKHNRALQVVFFTLFVLFWLLALGDYTGNAALKTFTGYEGMICGFSPIYLGVAQVLNETYGRTVLPVGDAKPAAPVGSPATANA